MEAKSKTKTGKKEKNPAQVPEQVENKTRSINIPLRGPSVRFSRDFQIGPRVAINIVVVNFFPI